MATAPLSVNAFARTLGVDEAAVRKGIRTGRLQRSVTTDAKGRPKIADVALAKAEWRDNADPSRRRGDDLDAEAPSNGHSTTTAEERRKLIRAQRRKVELEYRRRKGELVSAAAAENLWATRVVAARTEFLGMASRYKQRCPDLTARHLAVLEELIREALEALAGESKAPDQGT